MLTIIKTQTKYCIIQKLVLTLPSQSVKDWAQESTEK